MKGGRSGCIPKIFRKEKRQNLVMDEMWGLGGGGGGGGGWEEAQDSDLGGWVGGKAVLQEEYRKTSRFGG